MKTTNRKKLINLYLIFMAGGLTSCYNGNQYLTPTPKLGMTVSKNTKINYKPNIKIIGKDNTLTEFINNSDDKSFSLNDEKLSTLKLYLDTKLIPDHVEKPSVNLVGIIKKKKIKYNYQVSYKLVDSLKNTISQGSVIGISDELTETISGKAIIPTKSAAKDAATQLIKSLNKEISDILIDFKIVSTDDKNVFIAANKGIRFSANDIFIVNELSVPSTLSFDEIVKSPISPDTIIAKLKVTTGMFPYQGMTVTLQK